VWEELNGEFDLAELRWTPGHLSFITPELIERAKSMGLGLGAHGQRYHAGQRGGPPWRTLIESDLVALGAGTDGARINTLNPWCIIYYMVTGRDVSGELINDGQGGIAVGRFADLAVLDANIFDSSAVPDHAIRNMTSVLTIVNGEIVFDKGL
jgi:predicted amidohydrolase YtcJ